MPMQPMQPMQPTTDSGMQVESDAGDGAVVEPMLPPNFTLECPSDDVLRSGDPREEWAEQREAHGALGLPATLSLQGDAYRVEGSGVADVEAPFTLVAGNASFGIVVFGDARVDDLEERGDLSLYTGDLSSSTPREADAVSGSFKALGIGTVIAEEGVVEGMMDITVERRGNTDFFLASTTVNELELDGLYMASLHLANASDPSMQSIQWMPTGPVVIHEAAGLTLLEENVGSVRMPPAIPLDVHYTAFGVGGDFTSGALEIEGERVQGTPTAVFGIDAELRAEADSLEAVDGFRITQAINEVGLVLPASVQIVPEVNEIWVAPGEERVVRFHYREYSYTGDAVLAEIQAGGSADDLLEMQTSFLEDTLTAQLIGAIAETGWAAPIVAITAIPAISVVFVIDLFECVFGGCLDLPSPLEPFPQWIEAGGIGTMEVRVKGALGVGTYETSLTFVGRNYCSIAVPLTVHVGTEPPPPADAGSDAETDAGDGAVGEGG
jgi:hypothetical protein